MDQSTELGTEMKKSGLKHWNRDQKDEIVKSWDREGAKGLCRQ